MGSGDSLNTLVEKCPESFSNVKSSEWALIDVIADSGACATVMPKYICGNIRLRESAGSKSGVEYEVASWKAVPSFGERHCEIFCDGAASSMMMQLQVADIHRPLFSLNQAADQEFRSHLGYYGGRLEDTKSGEIIPIQRRGNLYIMQTWVWASPDKRPPDPSRGFAWWG